MAGGLQGRGTLKGMAATLLALALLAECAAGRSFPVRFLVVAILGRAVAVARAYVAREIEAEGWCLDLAFPDEPPAMRFAAAGADILALRLRLLAAVLGALAGAVDGSDGRPDHGSACPASRLGGAARRPAPDTVLLLFFPACRPPRLYDTS